MRRLLPLGLFCVLLSACGGGDTATCANTYSDDVLETCLPEDWNVVDRSNLDDRGVPEEVVVAFQSQQPYSGQFVTVTVTRETLSQPMTSEEYSEASVHSVQVLPGYEEVDMRDADVNDATVTLHIFTAQPREDQPEARFYQVSAVSGTIGYTLTAATPVTVPDELEEQVEAILTNVSLKAVEQQAEEPDDAGDGVEE